MGITALNRKMLLPITRLLRLFCVCMRLRSVSRYHRRLSGGIFKASASENNLQNGVTAVGDSPMSRMDAATLIYNSSTIELMPTMYQGKDEHKNFLNDIVGIYTLRVLLQAQILLHQFTASCLCPKKKRQNR